MNLGAYELYEAAAELPEPTWPDISMQEIVNISFAEFQIADMTHPVIKRLRGEI